MDQEHNIINWLDQQPWSTSLSRRTQNYGYQYDYTRKNIHPEPTTPISGPLLTVADMLHKFMSDAGYVVAESRRIMDSQKAGLINVDEIQVCYPVILVELFKYGGGQGQQGVAVFCEPGVLNVRIILYEMSCFADESGIRGEEELVKIARDIVVGGLDVIVDVFLLETIDSEGENYQQQQN